MKKEKRSTATLSKEAYIKKETRKLLLSLYCIIIGSVLVDGIVDGWKPTYILAMIVFLSVFVLIASFVCKKFLYEIYDYNFKKISSVNLVNESLSSETYTEIKPLHRIYEHSYFLISLTNIAKFYAIIKNELEVSIYVQFNTEDELRFLENIPKEKFHICYNLQ